MFAARLYSYLKQKPPLFAAMNLMRGKQAIALDYPIDAHPRYGFGLPRHPQLALLIETSRSVYAHNLTTVQSYTKHLHQLPASWWINGYLPTLDAATLYALSAERNPARYVEVGSGVSTTFVRRAIRDHALATTITSIDPFPRAEIDQLCDVVIRQPLEEVDLDLFRQLSTGDMLFIDNSHQAFQNSDVTVFFLDVLPNLPPGILVGIHDIFLPDDYPPSYKFNYYNEQYLLATWLLGGGQKIQIVIPNWFVSSDPELRGQIKPLFTTSQFQGVDTHGNIFWFQTTA